MKQYKYPDAKQIIVSGDIHGDFKTLVFKLCIRYGCTDTLLIVAGDCGFGFDKPGYYDQVYDSVADRLRKANNWIVFVRGNHDNPAYYAEERINHARWRTVPDYSIISVCEHNILCIGGATSIDRYQRIKENVRNHVKDVAYYWSDEAPEYKPAELEAIPGTIRIDTVITHTAPSFCELNSHIGLQSWAEWDSELIKDVASERTVMDQIFQSIKSQGHPLQKWFYGHFHQSWSGFVDKTHFSMLDIMEFKEV
ncbi:MAG: metallophosphoesterase [Bacteroidales bacterium]|nr:metallophosphoesterase [Bacteroidales bacterium]